MNLDNESQYIKPDDEGDLCTINIKHRQQFATTLPVRMVMICNDLPKFNDKSTGTWSRMVLIPFKVPIPAGQQVDTAHILEELRPEYGGILNWALKGLTRVLRTGSTRANAFSQSTTARGMIAEHQIRSNPFLEWFEEHVILGGNDETIRTEAYRDYSHWCKVRNYSPFGDNKHFQQLKARGYVPDRRQVNGDRQRIWRGVRLAP